MYDKYDNFRRRRIRFSWWLKLVHTMANPCHSSLKVHPPKCYAKQRQFGTFRLPLDTSLPAAVRTRAAEIVDTTLFHPRLLRWRSSRVTWPFWEGRLETLLENRWDDCLKFDSLLAKFVNYKIINTTTIINFQTRNLSIFQR